MRIIKLLPCSVLASALFFVSQGVLASEEHQQHSVQHDMIMHEIDQAPSFAHSAQQGHDHRKEHGAQIYAITTVDNQWLVNDAGDGAFKSKVETRIGTDENKIFLKAHLTKPESSDTEYDLKILYSRLLSDFWDTQIGLRYRHEQFKLDQTTDTEEKIDAVIGLHGMAPYFFETDAYLYLGEDDYVGLSLETERDLLLTQKLIVKPYLEVDVVFQDHSKYAKKSGVNSVTAGLETRYEMSKKIMPYVDIAYGYSKAQESLVFQVPDASEKQWQYGVGIRFKF